MENQMEGCESGLSTSSAYLTDCGLVRTYVIGYFGQNLYK